jgi:hypothetical protein
MVTPSTVSNFTLESLWAERLGVGAQMPKKAPKTKSLRERIINHLRDWWGGAMYVSWQPNLPNIPKLKPCLYPKPVIHPVNKPGPGKLGNWVKVIGWGSLS